MNDHLIKKLKISILLNILLSIIAVGLFCFLIKKTEWYTGFYYLIFPIYLMFKKNKIILEISRKNNDIVIESYSIFTRRKKLNLDINEIIELDFFNGFILKYKNSKVKLTEKFQINAEPWNNIYGQIKQLKLDFQEIEKHKNLIQ